MRSDTLAFLEALFAPCEQGFITFTAMHPDGQHPTPSRHVPVGDRACLAHTLARLTNANRQGWGAYVAVATRKTNLGRWRRGGKSDLLALPALFVDIDRPPEMVLPVLRDLRPAPSCVIVSGRGVHLYFWLRSLTLELARAERVLRGLAAVLDGDTLTVAQSMRVPQTTNWRQGRASTLCRILELHPARRYTLDDFAEYAARPRNTCSSRRSTEYKLTNELNPRVVDALVNHFVAQGFKSRGTWLSGPCVYPEHHKHGDARPSFAFNPATAYGFCHVCGTLLAKDLCYAVGIDPVDLGGLMKPVQEV
jgi:hypothetical protein